MKAKVVLTDDGGLNHGIVKVDDAAQGIVKVTLEAKPTIRDIEFKEYVRMKQQKGLELGSNKRELYF